MRFNLRHKLGLLVAVVAAALALTTTIAFAHERRAVGDYTLTVGWSNEPPLEGEKNGIDFRVMNTVTQKPVEGLDKTLKVDITHVPTKTTKTFDLQASDEGPGRYTADLIPTVPGAYRFHFTGTIEGAKVDQTFESGPNTFDDVGSPADLQFPVSVPQARELDSAVRGAVTTAKQALAQSSKGSSNVLGVLGLVFGVAGLGAGAGALLMARRKK